MSYLIDEFGGKEDMCISAPSFLIVMEGSLLQKAYILVHSLEAALLGEANDYPVLCMTERVTASPLLLHNFPSYCCVANHPKT